MSQRAAKSRRSRSVIGASMIALAIFGYAGTGHSVESDSTATPIKHVIVILGENRSFDHVFATYTPKSGHSVSNLLSKGILNADGTPGPNFALAAQSTTSGHASYFISATNKSPYSPFLPPPDLGGAPAMQSNVAPPSSP